VAGTNGNTLWDMISLGIFIPMIIAVDLRRKTIQALIKLSFPSIAVAVLIKNFMIDNLMLKNIKIEK
jgi:hypothetical protein